MQQFLQFIILRFIYISICFGRPHAHHQELNNCSSSLWFNRWSVVVAVLSVVVGPVVGNGSELVGMYRSAAVVELLMMGVRTPETC
jgi:hypothetical protein